MIRFGNRQDIRDVVKTVLDWQHPVPPVPSEVIDAITNVSRVPGQEYGNVLDASLLELSAVWFIKGRDARLEVQNEGGNSLVLEYFKPQDILFLPELQKLPGTFSYKLHAERCDVVGVLSKQFAEIASRYPALYRMLFQRTSERLSMYTRKLIMLATATVEERVYWELVNNPRNAKLPDGRIQTPRMTQADIASLVGSCRETVSRVLNGLVRSGRLESSSQGHLRRYFIPAS